MISNDEKTLEKITLYLEDLDSGISIIEVNEPFRQEKIIQLLTAKVPKKIHLIDLKTSLLSPLEELKSQIKHNPLVEIFFILNLPNTGNNTLKDIEILTDLNFSRDLYASLGKIIVFFLPTYFVDLIIYKAQDFFDFVSLTFKFPYEEKLLFETLKPLEDDFEIRQLENRAKFLDALLKEQKEINYDYICNLKELGLIYYKLYNANKALEYLGEAFLKSDNIQNKILKGEILNDIAQIYLNLRVGAHVLTCLEQALKLFKDENYKKGLIRTLNNYGKYYVQIGEYKKGLDYFEQSLKIIDEIKDNEEKITILLLFSDAYQYLNDNEKTEKYLAEAYNLVENIGNFKSYIHIVIKYTTLLSNKKEYDSAIKYLEYTLKLSKIEKSKNLESIILHNLGTVYSDKGELQKALEYFEKSLELSDNLRNLVSTTLYMVTIFTKRGDYNSAFEYLNNALELSIKHNYIHGQSSIYENISRVYTELGEYEKAIQNLKISLDLTKLLEEKNNEARILYYIGENYLILEKYLEAINSFEQSLELFDKLNNKNYQLKVIEKIAETYYHKGNYSKSIKKLKLGLVIAKELNDTNNYMFLLDCMVKCYSYLNKINKVSKYQKELVGLKEKYQI